MDRDFNIVNIIKSLRKQMVLSKPKVMDLKARKLLESSKHKILNLDTSDLSNDEDADSQKSGYSSGGRKTSKHLYSW